MQIGKAFGADVTAVCSGPNSDEVRDLGELEGAPDGGEQRARVRVRRLGRQQLLKDAEHLFELRRDRRLADGDVGGEEAGEGRAT